MPSNCDVEFMAYVFCRTLTDDQGIASFPPLVANRAGVFAAEVYAGKHQNGLRIDYGRTWLTLSASPIGLPAQISIVSGSGQTAVMGTRFPWPFAATVRRADGTPVAGVTLRFDGSVGSGGGAGTSFSQEAVTDSAGTASVQPTAPWALGMGELVVTYWDSVAASIEQARSNFIVTNEKGGFDLALQNLWWSGTAENGWGMTIAQHGERLFNVLFVYDAQGNPTWYVQPVTQWNGGFGGQLFGRLYSPRGTPWFAYEASKLQVGADVGHAFISFRGERAASLYTYFTAPAGSGSQSGPQKELVPQEFGRGLVAPVRGVGDMWWGGPEQNGWGVAIMEQAGSLFAVWFTYDEGGAPTWFVMPSGEWNGDGAYGGTLFRTRGAPWFTTYPHPYDPSRFAATPVGNYSIRFLDANRATFTASVDGRSITLQLSRQGF